MTHPTKVDRGLTARGLRCMCGDATVNHVCGRCSLVWTRTAGWVPLVDPVQVKLWDVGTGEPVGDVDPWDVDAVDLCKGDPVDTLAGR